MVYTYINMCKSWRKLTFFFIGFRFPTFYIVIVKMHFCSVFKELTERIKPPSLDFV